MARILVVDDDPGCTKLVESILVAEKHSVRTAADGEEGLAAAKKFEPEVVITDVEMPKMAGTQLCAAIRREERLKGAYLVVLTVHGEKGDRMKALLSGADDFLVKPARPDNLLGRVEVALRTLADRRALREAEGRIAAGEAARREILDAFQPLVRQMATIERCLGTGDPGGAVHAAVAARELMERVIRNHAGGK